MPGTLRKEGEGVDEQNHDAPKLPEIPSPELLENEIKRGRHRKTFIRVLKNTVFSLLVVVAVSAILTVLVLPVLQITGTSMSDTLQDGDIVIAVKSTDLETGDLIAFYYNNSILVKRVIASAGSWVDVKEDGTVIFNEINTMPGFTSISMYPMLWEARGVSKKQLVEMLIQSAFSR